MIQGTHHNRTAGAPGGPGDATGVVPSSLRPGRPGTARRALRAAGLCALLAGALLGCGREGATLSPEADDGSFRDGQQLEREGRLDEALVAYRKVIARRGDGAPESHLEAGLICLNHIKDPIAAIYYFRRYLELEPNARQAEQVRGMIDAAKRDFAATLPGHPLESRTERMGMLEQLDQLQHENAELKAQLGAIRTGALAQPLPHVALAAPDDGQAAAVDVAGPVTPAPPSPGPITSAPITAAPIEAGGGDDGSAGPGESPAPRGSPAVQIRGAVVSAPRSKPSKPSGPAAANSAHPGRRHAVAKGETLFSLAQKYYGSRSRWRDILDANRDVLPGEHTPLRIGMELRIP